MSKKYYKKKKTKSHELIVSKRQIKQCIEK